MKRFAFYGILGWIFELLFTGAASAIGRRDYAGSASTFLCMHPIYGAGGMLLEQVNDRTRTLPKGARAAIYLAIIYGIEYSSGALSRACLGRCPWDYGEKGRNVHGLIQLDYAPAWLLVALLFEPAREFVQDMEFAFQGRRKLPLRWFLRMKKS